MVEPANSDKDQDRIQVAMASWCGYSHKMKEAIDGHKQKNKFEVIMCDKDPDNKACQDIRAYPTFKKNGKVCSMGYRANVSGIVSDCDK